MYGLDVERLALESDEHWIRGVEHEFEIGEIELYSIGVDPPINFNDAYRLLRRNLWTLLQYLRGDEEAIVGCLHGPIEDRGIVGAFDSLLNVDYPDPFHVKEFGIYDRPEYRIVDGTRFTPGYINVAINYEATEKAILRLSQNLSVKLNDCFVSFAFVDESRFVRALKHDYMASNPPYSPLNFCNTFMWFSRDFEYFLLLTKDSSRLAPILSLIQLEGS